MPDIDLKPLTELGLTALEAEAYTFLLENSPATGYGVAKGIAKPAANTYKALEALHQKGAVIIDDGETRMCRAVPPDELLDTVRRRFDGTLKKAARELAGVRTSRSDNRIYQLQTGDQVFARLRKMLSRCQRVAILDLFPLPVQRLQSDIVAAAKRGVRITLKVYEPLKLPGTGIEIILDSEAADKIRRWPGQWANGIIDGEEYLLAFLSQDCHQAFQAVWSNNFYLARIYYSAIIHEIMFSAVETVAEGGGKLSRLKAIVKDYRKRMTPEASGYQKASPLFLETDETGRHKRKKP